MDALRSFGVVVVFCSALTSVALAGAHTWDVNEIYSSADGTVQFIELFEANGTPNEVNVGDHDVTSNSNLFTIPDNVTAPTSNKHILLATAAFAALPGAPAPDHIIPGNFFSLTADTVTYVPYDSLIFGAGQLPTDGILSLNGDLSTGVNSPTNYAGQAGSVDTSLAPPGVPSSAPMPLIVQKFELFPDGSRLRLTFDTATCSGNLDHQVLYGFGSQLPLTLGATYTLQGAQCSIGGSPSNWNGVPDPTVDPSNVLWFLVQATDGASVEGSWGKDSTGAERNGAGTNGSSQQCTMADKDLSNTCGQ